MKTTPLRAERIRPWLIHPLVLAIYTLLALAVTAPLSAHLDSQIIANTPGHNDGYLGIWNIWWAARAITAGQDPFFTQLLFHPQGLDLFWLWVSLPQGIIALPLTLTLGPLTTYNLLILASFVLGGYFAFLLARHVLTTTDSERRTTNQPSSLIMPQTDLAALVAGAIYAFAPFHMQKVLDAQLEVASIQWLPLFAWALLALLERRHWPYALLAGLLLLWVGLGTWYYGLFALIYTGLAAALWSVRGQEARGGRQEAQALPAATRLLPAATNTWHIHWSTFLWGISPIAIWLLVMAPRLLSLAQTGDAMLGDARAEHNDSVADLVSFWLPNPNHPLWGLAVTRWYETIHPGDILWNISLGLIGTLLAVFGLAWYWRQLWRWAALGLVAALLATGTHLIVLGHDTGIPMPYALICNLPGIRSSHRPNHVVLISILATALLAGAAVQRILTGRRRPGLLTAGLLAAIMLIDGWAGPPPLFSRPVPRPYLSMPAPDGALLPIPIHLNFANSENLWYQTFHHWPIVAGFSGREPPYPLGRYAPGIKELRFGSSTADDILSPGWPELARESLAAYHIRYVMFHKQAMGDTVALMSDLTAAMGLSPSYDDELITVYPVPKPARLRPLAYLGAGWGEIERQNGRSWRWMSDSAEIYLLNPTQGMLPVELTLDAEAFSHDRSLSLRLDSGTNFSLNITRARMQRSMHLMLPPGEHVLYLGALADSPPGQPQRRLSLAVLRISIH